MILNSQILNQERKLILSDQLTPRMTIEDIPGLTYCLEVCTCLEVQLLILDEVAYSILTSIFKTCSFTQIQRSKIIIYYIDWIKTHTVDRFCEAFDALDQKSCLCDLNLCNYYYDNATIGNVHLLLSKI